MPKECPGTEIRMISFPRFSFLPLLEMIVAFSFLRSPGYFYLSKTPESGLAMMLAKSLRTHGLIPSNACQGKKSYLDVQIDLKFQQFYFHCFIASYLYSTHSSYFFFLMIWQLFMYLSFRIKS